MQVDLHNNINMAALPQFTGKYTTPGEYENPKTVLDKAGFYTAKTIEQSGKIFADVINKQNLRRSKEAERFRKLQEENIVYQQTMSDQLVTNLEEAGVRNNSLYQLGYDLVSANSRLQLAIKTEQDQRRRQELITEQSGIKRKLAEYLGLINTFKSSNETYVTDDYTNPTQVASQGGVATVGENIDMYNKYNMGMPAINGLTAGGEAKFYLDENNQFRINISSDHIKNTTDDEGNLIFPEGSFNVNAAEFLSFDPLRVPEIDKALNKILTESGVIGKDGNVTDGYLNMSETTIRFNNDKTLQYPSFSTDYKKITDVTSRNFDALINSYLEDSRIANVIWKQVLGNDRDLISSNVTDTGRVTGSFISDEDQAEFKAQLLNRMLYCKNVGLLPEKQGKPTSVQKPSSNLTAEQKNELDKQARKQERFKEIKNLGRSPSGAGFSVPPGKQAIADYFIGLDFDGKRIVDVESVEFIEDPAGTSKPRRIVTLLVAAGTGQDTAPYSEKIDITDDAQVNNLIDQLSDPGKIPVGGSRLDTSKFNKQPE